MTNTSKTILWVLGIIVVVGGLWMLLKKPTDYTTTPQDITTSQTQTQPYQSSTATPNGQVMASQSNTSDASIISDTTSVDSQMNGLSSDSNASVPGSDSQ